MAMKAEDIADLLRREGSSAKDHYPSSETAEAMRPKRVELLMPVLATCREAWSSKSEDMSLIAEKLGDGSRDVAWRGPLGESGILEFFLGVLASGELAHSLQVHILRLTGNSCADTDENRARVVDGNHLTVIIDHLKYQNLIPFAVPVLYNIMVDYEPAQLLASRSHLSQQLIKILLSPDPPKFAVFAPYICKILTLLTTQDCEPALADPDTVAILLRLAMASSSSDDPEDFITTVSTALSYLASETFQERTMAEPHMKLFMSAFHHAYTNFDLKNVEDEDTAEQLKRLRSSLLLSLADITGHDGFAPLHSLQGEVAQTLLAWLDGRDAQLQSAACLALGNLSRSDEVSTSLVQTYMAHVPIMKLVSDPAISDVQVLHSALSFLKNLAVATENKPRLAGLLDLSCVPRLLKIDSSPQVQFSAISLIRLLLVGCPTNALRICCPTPNPAEEPSCVESILSLYRRSDAEPTRLEAARAIASVCRSLHTPRTESKPTSQPVENGQEVSEDMEEREFLYRKDAEIADILSLLVTQDKWPILRSEAWFVFALMCRSQDGAKVVAKILQIQGTRDFLCQAITGREMAKIEDYDGTAENAEAKQIEKSIAGDDQVAVVMGGLELEPKQVDPKSKESFTRVNQENALVMSTELLRSWAGRNSHSTSDLTSWLQDLVKEGTELLVAQSSKGETDS